MAGLMVALMAWQTAGLMVAQMAGLMVDLMALQTAGLMVALMAGLMVGMKAERICLVIHLAATMASRKPMDALTVVHLASQTLMGSWKAGHLAE